MVLAAALDHGQLRIGEAAATRSKNAPGELKITRGTSSDGAESRMLAMFARVGPPPWFPTP